MDIIPTHSDFDRNAAVRSWLEETCSNFNQAESLIEPYSEEIAEAEAGFLTLSCVLDVEPNRKIIVIRDLPFSDNFQLNHGQKLLSVSSEIIIELLDELAGQNWKGDIILLTYSDFTSCVKNININLLEAGGLIYQGIRERLISAFGGVQLEHTVREHAQSVSMNITCEYSGAAVPENILPQTLLTQTLVSAIGPLLGEDFTLNLKGTTSSYFKTFIENVGIKLELNLDSDRLKALKVSRLTLFHNGETKSINLISDGR